MELDNPSQSEIMIEAYNNLTQSFNITRATQPKCTFTPISAHPGFAIRVSYLMPDNRNPEGPDIKSQPQEHKIIAIICAVVSEHSTVSLWLKMEYRPNLVLCISTMKEAQNICEIVNEAIEEHGR